MDCCGEDEGMNLSHQTTTVALSVLESQIHRTSHSQLQSSKQVYTQIATDALPISKVNIPDNMGTLV